VEDRPPLSRLCHNRKATLLSVLLMPIFIAKKLIVTQSVRGGDSCSRGGDWCVGGCVVTVSDGRHKGGR